MVGKNDWAAGLVEIANGAAEFGDNRFECRGGLGIILLVEFVNGVTSVEDGGVGAIEGAAHFGGRAVDELAGEVADSVHQVGLANTGGANRVQSIEEMKTEAKRYRNPIKSSHLPKN